MFFGPQHAFLHPLIPLHSKHFLSFPMYEACFLKNGSSSQASMMLSSDTPDSGMADEIRGRWLYTRGYRGYVPEGMLLRADTCFGGQVCIT